MLIAKNHIDDALWDTLPDRILVTDKLGKAEILAQLAEEGAELSQAALKLRRVLDGRNPTPVTSTDALENLQEEFADVLVCMMMVGIDVASIARIIRLKCARWASRLAEEEQL